MKGLKLRPSEHTSHAHLRGVYELETLCAVERLVSPGMVCYDLGASIGYLSILMARRASKVFAFEPAPHARAEMSRQIEANDIHNIEVVPSPISGDVREVEFAITGAAYGSGIAHGKQNEWPVLKMTTSTIDQFIETHPAPDFLKIDIEGEEAVLFNGAQNLLKTAPPLILCELHSMEAARAVVGALSKFHYRFEDLSSAPFRIPEQVVAGEFHVIAFPPTPTQ